MTAREQRDRCGPHRRRPQPIAIPAAVARSQTRPCHVSRQASIIEPMRLVAGETRRQDLGFPGAGRCFETFELTDDGVDSVPALPSARQERHTARSDRKRRKSRAATGSISARNRLTVYSFMRASSRRSHHSSLASDVNAPRMAKPSAWRAANARRNLVCLKTEHAGERVLRDRTLAFKTAAQDFDQGLIARPDPPGIGSRGHDRWLAGGRRPEGPKLRQPLGRYPEHPAGASSLVTRFCRTSSANQSFQPD